MTVSTNYPDGPSALQSVPELDCKKASLVLEDGRVFHGFSFGYPESTSGEVVFNTGMVGYPESLTDPSYSGQILCITYPMVGNYGVPEDTRDRLGLPLNFESDKIHVKALVVSTYSFNDSHYSSTQSLASWLNLNKIPGIFGIDTRALTIHIREKGAMLGKVLIEGSSESVQWFNPNALNMSAAVSCKQPTVFHPSTDHEGGLVSPNRRRQPSHKAPLHIVLVDCGVKLNIIRYLVKVYGVMVTLVPWDFDFNKIDFDGLFISNGPGDPTQCTATIENLRMFMKSGSRKPIFGICLGNQILALAAGAKTYKMKFGNRGMNQPCIDLRTSKCYITSQNHGFAVDADSLPLDWTPLFINANDGSNEGIIHKTKPWFSCQFHPEAAGGPTDTSFLFQFFINAVSCPEALPVTTVPYRLPSPVKRVLVLGSGGLQIGQGGEFDYSGSQAIKALKEAGIFSILINPNIATVQTSPGLADEVYFLPVTPEFVEEVIKKEKPDGLMCTFGGQTALNCAVKLAETGVLKKYSVRVLGTPIEAIIMTEDRRKFADAVEAVGYKVAPSQCCTSTEEAVAAASDIGYPVLVRAAYTLGGLGSGFAHNVDELVSLLQVSFSFSSQVILDKSLKGWKEFEYEVVRDANDNCITVCNMENIDPMGVHTGDSIVVAPSQTLTNRQHFTLRKCALEMIRHIGVVGECNIQFAVDPASDDFFIIEVNARLSRSSALASKATGYPLAYVAAKLALGSDLVQLRNSVTKVTTACFEPSLDYCVVKIPRWDLKKFGENVESEIGSAMKSVGEVMAIGRRFEEAMQKALRMVDEFSLGFDSRKFEVEMHAAKTTDLRAAVLKELSKPTPLRMWAISKAFELGMTESEICSLSNIDPWFIGKFASIHAVKIKIGTAGPLQMLPTPLLKLAKQMGFSDTQVARYLGNSTESTVREHRTSLGIIPVIKQIDTLSGEFPAETNYLYQTYNGEVSDVNPCSGAKRAVVVLGCGCYRIGSSVEFDWCSVSAVRTLRKHHRPAIVINCNPETVSTDYDESDRLYFEELSLETVLDICDFEKPDGLIVGVGGQTPNNLAKVLSEAGEKILGTSVDSIDAAEDRSKFSCLCDTLKIDQPDWSEFTTTNEAFSFASRIGFPLLVRPSYVLSGAAMRAVYSFPELEKFLFHAAVVANEYPVVISKYIEKAKEIEIDAVGCDGDLVNYAISEHVENAGVHSGDASLLLPAQKLYVETHRQIKRITVKLCRALKISGPFNIQFLCRENEVKVIECNLRASRSMPFISKTFNVNLIEVATKVMIGIPVRPQSIHPIDCEFVGCKVSQFSFNRLKNADPRLGVEMHSTGEVACFGRNKYEAYIKGLIAVGFKIPKKSILISLGPEESRVELAPFMNILLNLGFEVTATADTSDALHAFGIATLKVSMSDAKNIILQGKTELLISVPASNDSNCATEGFQLRRAAVDCGVSLITDVKQAALFVSALERKLQRESEGKIFFGIESWNDYQRDA